MSKVFIIHGFMATPSDHWFPWLKAELESLGQTVVVLEMPNAFAPKASEWLDTLSNSLKDIDATTHFVCHSLGCIALLAYLQTRAKCQVGSITFVSGFAEPVPELHQLDEFVDFDLDAQTIIEMTTKRTLFASPHDTIVPVDLSRNLATELQMDWHEVPNAGHFLESDGYRVFPELGSVIKNIISH